MAAVVVGNDGEAVLVQEFRHVIVKAAVFRHAVHDMDDRARTLHRPVAQRNAVSVRRRKIKQGGLLAKMGVFH